MVNLVATQRFVNNAAHDIRYRVKLPTIPGGLVHLLMMGIARSQRPPSHDSQRFESRRSQTGGGGRRWGGAVITGCIGPASQENRPEW